MRAHTYQASAAAAFFQASVGVDQHRATRSPIHFGADAILLTHDWNGILDRQFLVVLWSTTEVLLRDASKEWLLHAPDPAWGRATAEIKVTLGEWRSKDRAEQAAQVWSELWTRRTDEERGPISRFESLFTRLGLPDVPGFWTSPTLSPITTRADVFRRMTELWALRNVIAHNLGFVDADFVRHWPGPPLAEASEISVTREDADRYFEAASVYLWYFVQRLAAAWPQDAVTQ